MTPASAEGASDPLTGGWSLVEIVTMKAPDCPSHELAQAIESRLAERLHEHYQALDAAESSEDRLHADRCRLDATATGLLFSRLRATLETHLGDHPAEGEALRELRALQRAVDAAA